MKLTSIALVSIVIGLGVGIIVWSQTGGKAVTAPAETVVAAAANNTITPSAGTELPKATPNPTAKNPLSPTAVTTPQPVAPTPQTTTQPAVAPAETVISKATDENAKVPDETLKEMPPELDEAVASELKSSVENQFKDKLSFPLTEQKMIAFADASLRVHKINNKWDVQIASADNDGMAIEYNNFAVEEITGALAKIPGLTLEQYNEMTKLTSTEPEFNKVYQVYKQLVSEGYFKKKIAEAKVPPGGIIYPAPAKANAVTPTNPAAKPANPGTVPVIQGSTAPQYSPPVSR